MPERTAKEQKKSATVIDVAKTAGVSVGTVSHVVSGARNVAPGTRLRVERAMSDLDFKPNQLARALVRGKTNTVGVVLPNVANPFFAELLRGIADELGAADYALLLGNSDNDEVKERHHLDMLRTGRVDGLVVVSSERNADNVWRLATHLPTVIADSTITGWTGDSVTGDSVAGMDLAVGHLVQLGHREIGLIGGDRVFRTASERRYGFELALRTKGLEPAYMSDGLFTSESGRRQAMTALTSAHRPSAICAANDLVAIGVLEAAHDLGILVPKELSVVGYDDIIEARLTTPPLTTIRQPALAMGRIAAQTLLYRLGDGDADYRKIVLPPEIVVRGSTGPGPARESAGSEGPSADGSLLDVAAP